jgi:hypothetical protein
VIEPGDARSGIVWRFRQGERVDLSVFAVIPLARGALAVAAKMQSPFDAMAKALIDAALEGVCDVSLQEPVAQDALYSDAVIDPRAPTEAITARGILGRMASVPCVIEAFATVPTAFDVDRCVARTSLRTRPRRSPE